MMVQKFSLERATISSPIFYMEHDEENKIDEEGLHELNTERVKKEFKTHRNAIDFDEKFIWYCF